MGKCIRCGKTCPDGRNMCDECTVWFRERTGSSGPAEAGLKKADTFTQPAQPAPSAQNQERNPAERPDTSSRAGIGSGGGKKEGKSGGKKPVLLLLVLLLIAGGIIAAVTLLKKNGKTGTDQTASQPQEYVEAETDQAAVQTEAQEQKDADDIPAETLQAPEPVTDAQTEEVITEEDEVITEEAEKEEEDLEEEDLEEEELLVPNVDQGYILNCQASSALAENGMVHSADRICDESLSKAWCEGAKGQGYGETVTIFFSEECLVSGFIIYNGYQKDDKRFYNNSRPSELLVSFSDRESQIISLEDGMGAQTFHLDTSHVTDRISFTIEEVYPGSKFQDTLISEVTLF